MLTQLSKWFDTTREVKAVQVPDGNVVTLAAATDVTMVHALGGDFAIRDRLGVVYRVDAADADALGKTAKVAAVNFEGPFQESWVLEQLHRCYDPEIPVNLVEMGLIYAHGVEPTGQTTDEGTPAYRVSITMTLTAPGCGMGQVMVDDVTRRLRQIPGVVEVNVELTFDPPWDASRMSEAARLQAGLV